MGPSICSEIETVSTAMGSFANLLTPNRRSAHRAPESLAESLRRTSDRLDPQGLPGPFHHLQRAASETNPKFLFHLLHGSRTHLGLDKQCPHVRPVSSVGTIA